MVGREEESETQIFQKEEKLLVVNGDTNVGVNTIRKSKLDTTVQLPNYHQSEGYLVLNSLWFRIRIKVVFSEE